MHSIAVIASFVFLLASTYAGAFLNFNTFEQPFVLEAKQIIIPDYPDAFNPSIIRWDDRYLMSFRTRDPLTHKANLVGILWLDDEFKPLGTSQLVPFNTKGDPSSYVQDPRLVDIEGKLYMAYSDLWGEGKAKKRRMFIAELNYDGVKFSTCNNKCLLDFDGTPNNKFEKNWVPFNYEGNLLLAYSLFPHKIFLPDTEKRRCTTVGFSNGIDFWQWGSLRGGTPALLVGDYYLAFFHSSMVMTSVQSDEKPMPHYMMGAYLFDKHPPFSVRKISPRPIVKREFYEGPMHHTWKPLRVIFPAGFVYDDRYIWISYGRQDYESWIVKLDKKELLKSLIPVQEKD